MVAKKQTKETASGNLLENLLQIEAQHAKSVPNSDLKPYWDKHICSRCALCYVYCPNAAISRQDDGYFNADMNLCSGCGICHRECWFGAVSMQEVD